MEFLKRSAYINGDWVETSAQFEVHNPFNSELIASVSDCAGDHATQAIDAASEAFKVWSNFSAGKRSRILKKWYQLQLEHSKTLAKILTTEQGKPFAEALGEIKYGASFVEWFAEEAKRVYGDTIPGHRSDLRITVIKQPVGVVAAITPWNFPSAMITRKIAPALAAGCTIVLKPSELTPLSAIALVELAEMAGFPQGVLNLVPSSQPEKIGQVFTSHPAVKKISFTGSTRVGKLLMKQSADQLKKLSLELGGNAPFIVFADANIEEAIEGCMASKFRNVGQTCISTNRIFVHEQVHDAFVSGLKDRMFKLKLGDGLERGTDIGPMINEAALAKLNRLLSDAEEKGANIETENKTDQGLLRNPALVCNVNREMDIFSEELFGPVAAVYKFKEEQEVIALANDTSYGLASYFYGNDYAQIWRVAEALEFGMVGINTGNISTAVAPFGGVKESGFGREGSKYGMDDYLNIKYMCWAGINS